MFLSLSPTQKTDIDAGCRGGAATREEALQQAQAEGLVLRVGRNGTGYYGVCLTNPGTPKPYQARVRRGGKIVSLGTFATAEEAALCVARTPEGKAAVERAKAAPPLTSEEALQQAQAEGLVLRVAENKAGYFGVIHNSGRAKPFQAKVLRAGKSVGLGSFVTAEEAALCVARLPEGQAPAAAERVAPAVLLTSEEALQQVQAEGLVLRVAENKTGYFGVRLDNPGRAKPYQAKVWRDGKAVFLGSFATAEEAALCVARSSKESAASAQSQGQAIRSHSACQDARTDPPAASKRAAPSRQPPPAKRPRSSLLPGKWIAAKLAAAAPLRGASGSPSMAHQLPEEPLSAVVGRLPKAALRRLRLAATPAATPAPSPSPAPATDT